MLRLARQACPAGLSFMERRGPDAKCGKSTIPAWVHRKRRRTSSHGYEIMTARLSGRKENASTEMTTASSHDAPKIQTAFKSNLHSSLFCLLRDFRILDKFP